MLPVVIGAALLAGAAAGDGIVLGERSPALLIVALPRGSTPSTPPTELSRAATAAFRARTGLDLRAAEQLGLDGETLSRCDRGARLSCWVLSARPGDPRPRGGSIERERPIAAILVLSVLPLSAGKDRISLTLVDTERALECRRAAGPDDPEAVERVEDCIFESAAKSEPVVLGGGAPGELGAFFEGRISGELAPVLEHLGELEPFGEIAVDSSSDGVELRVDGAPAGTAARGTTTITEVRPGRRVLTASRPGRTPIAVAVRVERARTATASIELAPLDAPEDDAARRWMIYSGAGAVLAGVALGAYALIASANVHGTCLVPSPDAACASLGQPTFALDAGALPSTDRERVNPPGLTVPSIAVGLAALGTGLAGGGLLLEEEGFPWITLAGGVALGAAGALITTAVDPR